MAHFEKPSSNGSVKYVLNSDGHVKRMLVLAGKSADIVLWGGGPNSEKLRINFTLSGVGTVTKDKDIGNHRRRITIKTTNGVSHVQALTNSGKVWAKFELHLQSPTDRTLAKSISTLLQTAAIAKLKFHVSGLHVKGYMYRRVASLIDEGRIIVKHTPGGGGQYIHPTDLFLLPFQTPGTVNEKGLVIHEATHAAHDAVYRKGIDVIKEEAAAYLAQMTYARAHLNQKPNFGNGNNSRVFEIGWELAAKVLAKSQPSDSEIGKLKEAVRIHSDYRAHAHNGSKYRFTGVK